MSFATDEFKQAIQDTYLKPSFIRDVKDFTHSRFSSRKWGERLELYANIATALAIVSTSIGLWSADYIKPASFVTLVLGSSNMTLVAVSNRLKKQATRSTDQLNHTLKSIGVETHMPNVVDGDESKEMSVHSPRVLEINSGMNSPTL